MTITITLRKKRNMGGQWVYGFHADGYVFQAAVFEAPSCYGIKTEQYPQGNMLNMPSRIMPSDAYSDMKTRMVENLAHSTRESRERE